MIIHITEYLFLSLLGGSLWPPQCGTAPPWAEQAECSSQGSTAGPDRAAEAKCFSQSFPGCLPCPPLLLQPTHSRYFGSTSCICVCLFEYLWFTNPCVISFSAWGGSPEVSALMPSQQPLLKAGGAERRWVAQLGETDLLWWGVGVVHYIDITHKLYYTLLLYLCAADQLVLKCLSLQVLEEKPGKETHR